MHSSALCTTLTSRKIFKVKHPQPLDSTDEVTQVDSATPPAAPSLDEQEITTSLSRLSLPSTQKHQSKRPRRQDAFPATKRTKLETHKHRVMRIELFDAEDQPESFRCFDEVFEEKQIVWPELDSDCPTDQEQVDYTRATLVGDLCGAINSYWFINR